MRRRQVNSRVVGYIRLIQGGDDRKLEVWVLRA